MPRPPPGVFVLSASHSIERDIFQTLQEGEQIFVSHCGPFALWPLVSVLSLQPSTPLSQFACDALHSASLPVLGRQVLPVRSGSRYILNLIRVRSSAWWVYWSRCGPVLRVWHVT